MVHRTLVDKEEIKKRAIAYVNETEAEDVELPLPLYDLNDYQ